MNHAEDFSYSPPPGPPPILSEEQLIQLIRQGWLTYTLPESLVATVTDLFRHSTEFFELAESEKKRAYPSKLGTEFGYYPVPEEKEYITFRCRIGTSSKSQAGAASPLIQDLEDTAAAAWQECGTLLYRILCDLARLSRLDPFVWNDILDGTLTIPDSEDDTTYTLLRLFRYLPTTGQAEKHTDLGLLTICIGDRGGLEVLDREKSTKDNHVWVNPTDGPHTGAILIGNTLRTLSGNRYNSGVHRVVGNSQGRNSTVFALRHSSKHDVDFGLFGGGEARVSPAEMWEFMKVGKVNVSDALDFIPCVRDIKMTAPFRSTRSRRSGRHKGPSSPNNLKQKKMPSSCPWVMDKPQDAAARTIFCRRVSSKPPAIPRWTEQCVEQAPSLPTPSFRAVDDRIYLGSDVGQCFVSVSVSN